MKKKERILYIDGLKGLVCCLIMLGHFCGIYKYAEDATQIQCGIVNVLTTSFLKILSQESFWLYLFFVLSGYLLAFATISTFGKLLEKCIARFIRFAIPILGAAVIIFMIQAFFGFYNEDLQLYITNPWFTENYATNISWQQVIMAPIDILKDGNAAINSPYWVLRDMFRASILIYICLFVKNKLETRFRYIGEVTSIVVLVGLLCFKQIIIAACLLGMIINWQEQRVKKLYVKYRVLILIALCLPIAGYLSGKTVFYPVGFAMMLTAIPEISVVKKICEAKPVLWLGKISFGIYSFHWPVICSLGSLIILKLIGDISNNTLAILSFGGSLIATLLVAIVFYFSVEKFTNKICREIKKLFSHKASHSV